MHRKISDGHFGHVTSATQLGANPLAVSPLGIIQVVRFGMIYGSSDSPEFTRRESRISMTMDPVQSSLSSESIP
jgi:hypothetical protein